MLLRNAIVSLMLMFRLLGALVVFSLLVVLVGTPAVFGQGWINLNLDLGIFLFLYVCDFGLMFFFNRKVRQQLQALPEYKLPPFWKEYLEGLPFLINAYAAWLNAFLTREENVEVSRLFFVMVRAGKSDVFISKVVFRWSRAEGIALAREFYLREQEQLLKEKSLPPEPEKSKKVIVRLRVPRTRYISLLSSANEQFASRAIASLNNHQARLQQEQKDREEKQRLEELHQREVRLELLRKEAKSLGIEDIINRLLNRSEPDEPAAREFLKQARARLERQEFLARLQDRVTEMPVRFRDQYNLPLLLDEVTASKPGRPYRKALYALESALDEAEQSLVR